MVLIMSVNPGFGGQSFIPFCKDKIAALSAMIRERGLPTLIQVDGGVTLDNARELFDLGADVLVSGSAFFGFPPYAERHKAFQEAVQGK
jgi:ribulose-phosphate 3-epimerase